eukprot:scaffold13_cov377-Prasinococcus_capsulatus_cf.AAC.13
MCKARPDTSKMVATDDKAPPSFVSATAAPPQSAASQTTAPSSPSLECIPSFLRDTKMRGGVQCLKIVGVGSWLARKIVGRVDLERVEVLCP